MARHDKVYGFTISLPEEKRTCPTLFRHIAEYKEAHHIPTTTLWKAIVSASWAPWPFRSLMAWLFNHTDRNGDGWNMCHYWSNFEIASLDFFRGKEYQDLFEYLDRSGGFYHERVSGCHYFSFFLCPLLLTCIISSGATQRFIPWHWRCYSTLNKFIISRILDTAMTGSIHVPPMLPATSSYHTLRP